MFSFSTRSKADVCGRESISRFCLVIFSSRAIGNPFVFSRAKTNLIFRWMNRTCCSWISSLFSLKGASIHVFATHSTFLPHNYPHLPHNYLPLLHSNISLGRFWQGWVWGYEDLYSLMNFELSFQGAPYSCSHSLERLSLRLNEFSVLPPEYLSSSTDPFEKRTLLLCLVYWTIKFSFHLIIFGKFENS